MISEIKLQLIKGQVHKSYDVANVITDMFTKFRSDSVPYQKEIMNAITDSAVTEVTVMSSAQIGKTTKHVVIQLYNSI